MKICQIAVFLSGIKSVESSTRHKLPKRFKRYQHNDQNDEKTFHDTSNHVWFGITCSKFTLLVLKFTVLYSHIENTSMFEIWQYIIPYRLNFGSFWIHLHAGEESLYFSN